MKCNSFVYYVDFGERAPKKLFEASEWTTRDLKIYIYIYIYTHILHYLYEWMADLIGCSCFNLFSWLLHILLIWFWSHSITHPVYLMVIWCLNFTYYQYKRVKEVESWRNSNCLPPKVIGHRFESKNQLL